MHDAPQTYPPSLAQGLWMRQIAEDALARLAPYIIHSLDLRRLRFSFAPPLELYHPLNAHSALFAMPQQVKQIIADRYIDQGRLQNLLAQNFVPGTYSMTVSLTDCHFAIPDTE